MVFDLIGSLPNYVHLGIHTGDKWALTALQVF